MQEIINKVCSILITNPHVIGIIDDCNPTVEKSIIDSQEEEERVDLCIISRETGNQKTLYMEDGIIVCLKWRTEVQFLELLIAQPHILSNKRILYDRTGVLNRVSYEKAV